jgi:hypothetical protein
MKRILMLGGFAFLLSFPLACSTIDYELLVYDQPSPVKRQYTPVNDGDFFFAVAVSGGGSRAAVFSAAVMEELYKQVKLPDGRSIIDEIDYISSVSGGSLSMAYYCMNKPNVDSSHTDLYDRFFDTYRTDMRRNIEGNLVKNLFRFYKFFLTSEETGLLLKQSFDKLYFNNRKFDELGKRQRNGWSPTLIMNGTVMDTGAKFLFTTLTKDDFDGTPKGVAEDLSRTGFGKSGYHFGGDLLGVTFCDDIGLSIGDMEVSRGVAASASVPLLLGPIVLKDQKRSTPDEDFYIHVSDGGINDNQGVATIMQLMIDRLIDTPGRAYRGGLVIIIDSNHSIDPAKSIGSVRGFKLAETAERAMNISFFRGKALTYITIMFLTSSDPRYKDVAFVYISPYLADDEDISRKFEATPTRFKITPDRADNLSRAAAIGIGKARDKILDAYLPGSVNNR